MNNFVWINGKRGHWEIFAWKIEIFWWNCLIKIKIFRKFALKNQIFGEIVWKKSKFFGNLLGKSTFSYPVPRPSQISNQIDAAGINWFQIAAIAHHAIYVRVGPTRQSNNDRSNASFLPFFKRHYQIACIVKVTTIIRFDISASGIGFDLNARLLRPGLVESTRLAHMRSE